MTAPEFVFTTRVRPVVEFGRSEHRILGNDRWGRRPDEGARWGEGRWGSDDWQTIWTDTTCEIHEVTTDVGRGGATDRFVPGTASIVASNVHQLSEMMFPHVDDERFELVPQPPIVGEEDLQAPDAATVVSNGWSFTDDFETAPPRWIFPPAFGTSGVFPTVPLLYGDGYVVTEIYRSGTAYEGHGAAQWTRGWPNDLNVVTTLVVENIVGTTVAEIYANGNTTDQSCLCGRVTFTGTTIVLDVFRMGPNGERLAGPTPTTLSGTPTTATIQLNVSPIRPETGSFGFVSLIVNGSAVSWTVSAANMATGTFVGFGLHYVGTDSGTSGARVTSFVGPDFDDDFARPAGPGWIVGQGHRQYDEMIVVDGAMRPPEDSDGLGTLAVGSAQWISDFDGDQFIEIEITGMSVPVVSTSSATTLELSLKANERDLRSITATIDYIIDWDPDECSIDWRIVQYGPTGEYVYDPDVEGVSFGTIHLGVTNGVFPEPSLWRLEADTIGEVRLYYNGGLLSDPPPVFPAPPDGSRVGVYESWTGGRLWTPDTGYRSRITRIERLAAGLREPLGTEALGLWVRIGVDHETEGRVWFFRGFVDALTPIYEPQIDDTVRIECIDSLGEAGRVAVDGAKLSGRFRTASERTRQILRQASWPRKWRTIYDSATLESRPPGTKALDLLTTVAESCGGAVYGDPATGDVVFRGMDWQAIPAGQQALAFISNFAPVEPPSGFEDVPVVCPVGWERSSRREDMNTRVRFSTETSDTESGAPIVREWRGVAAEEIYGVELYESSLICATRPTVDTLARRQLRLRHPNQYPRIEAVVLDAATGDEALDLMTTASFTIPSKYRCQHRGSDGFIFNRGMLVTGIRHTMAPERWITRLALDPASVFASTGGLWGISRWGYADWGKHR